MLAENTGYNVKNINNKHWHYLIKVVTRQSHILMKQVQMSCNIIFS